MSNNGKNYTNEKNFNKHEPRPRPEPHPVAKLLVDNIGGQMIEFLKASQEERFDLSNSLFEIKSFPSDITGCEGAENYSVYQMERTTRMRKDQPDVLPRMSTAIVLVDKTTGKPAFYLSGYISPKETAAIVIYCMDEKGTDYRKTVRWNSREYGF